MTYNYDRLIEYKLMAGLWSKFGAGETHWPAVTERVIHLHGSLGDLNPSPNHVPFGARGQDRRADLVEKIHEHLETSERSIRIVHEAKPDDANFQRARELLKRAERVFFLGFGFGRTNVDRLDFGHINQRASICYSRMDMTEQEWSLYIREPMQRASLSDIRASNASWDSLQLLREHIGELVQRY